MQVIARYGPQTSNPESVKMWWKRSYSHIGQILDPLFPVGKHYGLTYKKLPIHVQVTSL